MLLLFILQQFILLWEWRVWRREDIHECEHCRDFEGCCGVIGRRDGRDYNISGRRRWVWREYPDRGI